MISKTNMLTKISTSSLKLSRSLIKTGSSNSEGAPRFNSRMMSANTSKSNSVRFFLKTTKTKMEIMTII